MIYLCSTCNKYQFWVWKMCRLNLRSLWLFFWILFHILSPLIRKNLKTCPCQWRFCSVFNSSQGQKSSHPSFTLFIWSFRSDSTFSRLKKGWRDNRWFDRNQQSKRVFKSRFSSPTGLQFWRMLSWIYITPTGITYLDVN